MVSSSRPDWNSLPRNSIPSRSACSRGMLNCRTQGRIRHLRSKASWHANLQDSNCIGQSRCALIAGRLNNSAADPHEVSTTSAPGTCPAAGMASGKVGPMQHRAAVVSSTRAGQRRSWRGGVRSSGGRDGACRRMRSLASAILQRRLGKPATIWPSILNNSASRAAISNRMRRHRVDLCSR